MDLTKLSIVELLKGYEAGSFSPAEVLDAYFARIKEKDGDINSYVCVTEDFAKKQLAAGRKGLLANIPMGLKDVFSTEGIPTTACSEMLRDFKPSYNAPVVDRLYEAGTILLGKNNTDQFTCGASTETSCFGVTKNPHDLTRVSGGSSGGSAAAVAADLCAFSMGTDTGGSIRQPASLCGAVGLKVTYGRVPRSGVISMASSLDTIGPITKTSEDAALVMNVIAGRHPLDQTTPDIAVPDYTAGLNDSIKGLKIGLPKEYFSESVDKEVQKSVLDAVEVLKSLGAEVKEISLPMTKYGVAVYYIISPSEVSSNMARYDGVRYGARKGKDDAKDLYEFFTFNRGRGFGDEMKRRIMLGTYALSSGYYDAYYKKATRVRTLIVEDFDKAFSEVDVIAAPVSPFPAFKIGEKAADPVAMYNADALTIPSAIAGLPGLSVPTGKNSEGLPISVQFITPQWQEALALRVGHQYEQARGAF